MHYSIETLTIEDSPMEVFLFQPQGTGPWPGLILCQHIPGHDGVEHDEFTLAAAQRLADEGFYVAVPFIFHWWPKSGNIKEKGAAFRDDWVIKDMRHTVDLLARSDDVTDQIGVIGHCWGGRVSWLGAAHLPVQACAIFYGGRIDVAMGAGNPRAIELAGKINCPVIGFFGNEDQNPTPALVDSYEAALKVANVDYEFHRYEGAGHAFQNFPTPERYRKQQSEDAWQHCINFFNRTLSRR